MNSELVRHDIRAGILRKRYLLIPVFFLLACFNCRQLSGIMMEHATWLDYYLSCFAGEMPIVLDAYTKDGLSIPYHWLFAVSGGLILNLDYLLLDLETEGIQYILQTKKRTSWFASKAVWNLTSSALYFLGAGVTAVLFTIFSGDELQVNQISKVSQILFLGTVTDTSEYALWKLWLCGICFPFLGFCMFNLLQMILCLFLKPAISLMICLGILVFSIYLPYPWMPGNALMGIRNMLFLEDGRIWIQLIVLAICFAGSLLTGRKRIRRMDLLGQEVL